MWQTSVVPRMVLGGAVQRKGFGSAVQASRASRMASLSSLTKRKTLPWRRRLVRVATRTSTALIEEAEIGLKWA